MFPAAEKVPVWQRTSAFKFSVSHGSHSAPSGFCELRPAGGCVAPSNDIAEATDRAVGEGDGGERQSEWKGGCFRRTLRIGRTFCPAEAKQLMAGRVVSTPVRLDQAAGGSFFDDSVMLEYPPQRGIGTPLGCVPIPKKYLTKAVICERCSGLYDQISAGANPTDTHFICSRCHREEKLSEELQCLQDRVEKMVPLAVVVDLRSLVNEQKVLIEELQSRLATRKEALHDDDEGATQRKKKKKKKTKAKQADKQESATAASSASEHVEEDPGTREEGLETEGEKQENGHVSDIRIVDEEPFVSPRRRTPKPREGAEGMAQFYLGGCSPSYTQYDLRHFLKRLNFEGVRCWKLAGGGKDDRHSSFKIQVREDDAERLLDLDYWKKHGLRVRKFFQSSPLGQGPTAAPPKGPAVAQRSSPATE